MNVYEAEVCIDGIWNCEPVITLAEFKESQKVNIQAERALFEANNKVPNGVFFATGYYNFTQGTDQTTWMIFNNKWMGWLECTQARAKLAEQLEVGEN